MNYLCSLFIYSTNLYLLHSSHTPLFVSSYPKYFYPLLFLSHSGQETTYTVTDLLPGHKYSFTVVARSNDVWGEEGPAEILEVPPERPSQPAVPKIVNRSKTNLTLRWNPPQDNGAAVEGYSLEWDQVQLHCPLVVPVLWLAQVFQIHKCVLTHGNRMLQINSAFRILLSSSLLRELSHSFV